MGSAIGAEGLAREASHVGARVHNERLALPLRADLHFHVEIVKLFRISEERSLLQLQMQFARLLGSQLL